MDGCRQEHRPVTGVRLPESPRLPMEFLSRSWSVSALEVSKALAPPPPPSIHSMSATSSTTASIPEDIPGESEVHSTVSGDSFSLASSAAAQLVLERIMSQSEISPLNSGRPSHSGEPLNGGQSCGSFTETDSPRISPSEDFDDVVKFFRSNNTLQPQFTGNRTAATTPGGGGKTVGRWLKDRREKKKEETRTHNAQLHAAISVAGVAAAIAAITAATSASSGSGKDEQMAKTDMALASAATLVAAQCVEAAEAMGAERDHLTSVVSSAVNVRSYDDIITLTAAAATALRGAATLKARALKEAWNNATVLPVEKRTGTFVGDMYNEGHSDGRTNGEFVAGDNFLGVCSQEFVAKGCVLLKRTRKGDLHWKFVSVYINRAGQVMLKMRSKRVAATITKKKKNVVLEVCKDLPAWSGRYLLEGGEQRCYFGLKTEMRGMVEFECKNHREHDIWTDGVSKLLSIVAERKE